MSTLLWKGKFKNTGRNIDTSYSHHSMFNNNMNVGVKVMITFRFDYYMQSMVLLEKLPDEDIY